MRKVKIEIIAHLNSNGRQKVNSIANGIDYSHGYVLQNAKELRSSGKIEGEKGTMIPGYIINGNYVILTSSRKQIVEAVRKNAPAHVGTVSSKPTVKEMQKYVRNNVADAVASGPRPWEFWT